MTSFKRFESKLVVKIILIYDRLNLWHHRQFITIFYQFLHIRIEIIHRSHMYILFLPRIGLYVSILPLANAWGKTSWHKGLPVVKTIYTMSSMNYFLSIYITHTGLTVNLLINIKKIIIKLNKRISHSVKCERGFLWNKLHQVRSVKRSVN